jgi:1-deoxy-D-xylulose-5-phosphate reductoisomerase
MDAPAPRLNLAEIGTLTFEEPDPERFPALTLARGTLEAGGTAPTVLNAANEIAVQSFLKGGIGFLDIARVVEQTLALAPQRALASLDDVFDVDRTARELAERLVSRHSDRG